VAHDSRARITFLGHSTVLLELDGLRILTDPILRTRVGPLVRAHAPVAREHWTGIDAVLVSHSHWDHLDPGSLELVGAGTRVLVPRGLGGRLRARGFERVTEVVPGAETTLGGVRIETVPAAHHGFGPPVGPTELSVGYLVRGSQGLYFAGDTALFAGMAELAGHVDVALLPVWGWGPRAQTSEHLDPLDAARALALIRPRVAVPIHWGTLHPLGMRWLRPATRVDPPHQFARLARLHAPGTTVRVLPVGASIEVSSDEGPEARPADEASPT
jgi:L-ascorbate metabolism protein UlaG (beta-lactamase superfamily)